MVFELRLYLALLLTELFGGGVCCHDLCFSARQGGLTLENEKNKDDLTPSDGAESQKDSGTVSPGTVEGDSAIVTPPEGEPPMLESEMGGVSPGGQKPLEVEESSQRGFKTFQENERLFLPLPLLPLSSWLYW